MEEKIALIVSTVLLMLIVAAIPLVWQMWRTAKSMADTLEELNRSLPQILKNLEDISQHISTATATLNREVENFAVFGRKIRGFLEIGEQAGFFLRRGIQPPLLGAYKTAMAAVKGMHAFLNVLSAKGRDAKGGSDPCQR